MRTNAKKVQFLENVGVREYEVILTNLPIEGGYPLGLGWNYNVKTVMLANHQKISLQLDTTDGLGPPRLSASERKARFKLLVGLSANGLVLLDRRQKVANTMLWTYKSHLRPPSTCFKTNRYILNYVM